MLGKLQAAYIFVFPRIIVEAIEQRKCVIWDRFKVRPANNAVCRLCRRDILYQLALRSSRVHNCILIIGEARRAQEKSAMAEGQRPTQGRLPKAPIEIGLFISKCIPGIKNIIARV